MKKTIFRTMILIMAGILVAGSNQIMAQNNSGKPGGPKGIGYQCNIPDLTEAQQKKMDEIRTAHQKNMLQFRNQMDIKTANLQALRSADKADMNAINKSVDEIGALKIQMMKERENHIQQIRSVLTDDQRVQFDMRKGKGQGGNFGNCRMGMHGKRGNGNGKGYGPCRLN